MKGLMLHNSTEIYRIVTNFPIAYRWHSSTLNMMTGGYPTLMTNLWLQSPRNLDFYELPLLLSLSYTYYLEVVTVTQVDILLFLQIYNDKMKKLTTTMPMPARGWSHTIHEPLTAPSGLLAPNDSCGSTTNSSYGVSQCIPKKSTPTRVVFFPRLGCGHGLPWCISIGHSSHALVMRHFIKHYLKV